MYKIAYTLYKETDIIRQGIKQKTRSVIRSFDKEILAHDHITQALIVYDDIAKTLANAQSCVYVSSRNNTGDMNELVNKLEAAENAHDSFITTYGFFPDDEDTYLIVKTYSYQPK